MAVHLIALIRKCIIRPNGLHAARLLLFTIFLLIMNALFAQNDTLQVESKESAGLESEVRYSATDSIRFDVAGQRVFLFGEAKVYYENIELAADNIIYGFGNQTVMAYGSQDSLDHTFGKPLFSEGDHDIMADTIRYNFETKIGLIKEVRTNEDESYIQAKVSKRHADGEIHNKGGIFTTCDHPNPHYHFKMSKMIVRPGDKIIAGPAYMKVWKIPLPLGIPFGLFPINDRGTAGILLPTYGESATLGFYLLNGGFYTPLGEKADLQVTGDYYTRGSWGARVLSRYKTRYRYSGSLDLKTNTTLNGDPDFPNFSRTRSFFVRWSHLMDPKAKPNSRFSANVNLGTSNSFTNNFNSSNQDYLSNTFQSNISYSKSWSGKPYSLSVNLRHSQNTLNETFDITLPQVAFNVSRFFLPLSFLRKEAVGRQKWYEKIGVSYTMNFENRLSTTEDQLSFDNLDKLVDDMRNGFRQQVNMSTSLKKWNMTLNPNFRFTERWYFETIEKSFDNNTMESVTDTLPGFSRAGDWSLGANLSSKIYGMYQFKNSPTAFRHVVTPSLGLSYRPDQSTQEYGYFGPGGSYSSYSPYDIGIYGKPPSGESGLVTMSLINSLDMKVRAKKDTTIDLKKIKLIDNFTLNSAYDMVRDSLNWNPIGISGRTSLFNQFNINFRGLVDPYTVSDNGVRLNESEWKANGRIGRLTDANVALGFDLKNKKRAAKEKEKIGNDDNDIVGEANPDRGARVDWNMPWRMNVNYSFNYANRRMNGKDVKTISSSVLFNGDVTLFKHWKFAVTSGYDFEGGEWTVTTLNLYWDLHCWEFNFNTIPFGVRKSYGFRINVKASILQDLKYDLRKNLGGNDLLF